MTDEAALAGLAGLAASTPRLPKAYRLKETLLEMVDGMPPGSPIAAERVLSERYGVSRATVRQALQDLVFEGRLQRLHGRGTFVAPPKLAQTLRLTSHTREMEGGGLVPSSTLLDCAAVAATGEVAAMLELDDGAPAWRIERLRLADGEPMAIELLHVAADRFPGLDRPIADGASFYETLRDDYGVTLARGEETIECVLASPRTAALLTVEPRSPVLKLTRRSWDRDDGAVEYVESLYRGDRYRFVTQLEPDRRGP